MAGTTRISVCILYFIGLLGFSVPECLNLDEKGGYIVSSGKQFCYKTYTAKLVWNDAKDACQLKGGHLAKLTGKNHGFDVYKGLSGFSFKCVWIGMSDPKNDGDWKWLDDFVSNNREVSTTLSTPVVPQESTSSFTSELTTLPTEETTSPVVQNRNLRPKKVLQHSSTKRQIVMKAPVRGTIRGKPVLQDNVYSVSMCARLCLRSTTDCTQFNYNLVTHQCLVFGGNEPYHAEEGSDWDIWTVS